jgi:opacity protein-like surface antigen
VIATLFLLSGSLSAFAQTPSWFTFHTGVGATPLVGDISSRLDTGWHFNAGAGVKVGRAFQATLDYTYHGFNVGRSVLNEFQVPNGNARLWSVTVNPKIQIPTNFVMSPYVIGGVGYYRRTVEFTQPTVAQGLVFDPFFDTFFSVPFVADQVLGRVSRSGIGGSLGGGFEIKLGSGDENPRVFTEARYENADTGRIPTRMVPVTVGLRW